MRLWFAVLLLALVPFAHGQTSLQLIECSPGVPCGYPTPTPSTCPVTTTPNGDTACWAFGKLNYDLSVLEPLATPVAAGSILNNPTSSTALPTAQTSPSISGAYQINQIPMLAALTDSGGFIDTLVGANSGEGVGTQLDLTGVGFHTLGACAGYSSPASFQCTGLATPGSSTGSENTAVGTFALSLATTASFNAAFGAGAMGHDLTGVNNVAMGADAMRNESGMNYNVAVGRYALACCAGQLNVAIGYQSMIGQNGSLYGTTAAAPVSNVAIGANTLSDQFLTTPTDNVAVGALAMSANLAGNNSTAIGYTSQEWWQAPNFNTSVGASAMQGNGGVFTGTVTSGSPTIAVTGSFPSQIANGDVVGDYTTNAVPAATTVLSFSSGSNTITLSANATATTTGSDTFKYFVPATGQHNAAVGYTALTNTTGGSFNVGVGDTALAQNTTGSDNTAIGYFANAYDTTATGNSAVGYEALEGSTGSSGNNNSAFGATSLTHNTTGGANTAMGNGALNANTTGISNTAVGYHAGVANTTGSSNTFVGFSVAPTNATSGNYNGLFGVDALCDIPVSGGSAYLVWCGQGGPEVIFSGTATPATSIAEFKGSVQIDGGLAANTSNPNTLNASLPPFNVSPIVVDNSPGLSAWIVALQAGGICGYLPSGGYNFQETLLLTALKNTCINGDGRYVSVLNYTGASTTNDLIQLFGTSLTVLSDAMVTIQGIGLTSSTTMTAGCGWHMKWVTHDSLTDVTAGTQLPPGSPTLWNSYCWEDTDWQTLTTFEGFTQNDVFQVSGVGEGGAGLQYDLYIHDGKIKGGNSGVHIGGGWDGFGIDDVVDTDSGYGVIVDEALVPVGTAGSGTTTTSISDATKSWAPNNWNGSTITITCSSTPYTATVSGNTATTMTVSTTAALVSGCTYALTGYTVAYNQRTYFGYLFRVDQAVNDAYYINDGSCLNVRDQYCQVGIMGSIGHAGGNGIHVKAYNYGYVDICSAQIALNAADGIFDESAGATVNICGSTNISWNNQYGIGADFVIPPGHLNLPSMAQLTNNTSGAANQDTGLIGFTIALLPACGASNVNTTSYVTNGVASPTYLSVVGGTTGSTLDPIYCTGSAWVYR